MTKKRPTTKSRSKTAAGSGLPVKTLTRSGGIVLVFVAALTLLSLLSLSRGVITEQWIRFLRVGLGWGRYLFPLAIGALGFWLFLRSFDRVSEPDWGRWGGIVLLLFALLGLFHAFAPDPKALAERGAGGGYLGMYMRQALVSWLGQLGMVIFLLTSLVVALVLVFDISTLTFLTKVHGAGVKLLDWYRAWRLGRSSMPAIPRDNSLPARLLSQIRGEGERTRREAPKEKPAVPSPPEARLLQPRIIGGKEQKWQLPPTAAILEDSQEQDISQAEIRHRVRIIEETLLSFGVPGKVTEVNQGPTITQFGVEPGYLERRDGNGKAKVKVNQISALVKDLELALAASPIRIEAPVPGRSVVGIEVPNVQISLVSLRGVMESEEFKTHKGNLVMALGRDVSGQPIVADLTAMPHLLIAGATGSGKSVCINAIIACLLCTHTPDTLRVILVDPKMVELVNYNGIPHLLSPVVIEIPRVVETLKWATREMERRYRLFSKAAARNIEVYNRQLAAQGEKPLPLIVIFIDELADIMMAAADEVERSVCRIAQMARATGIHLVLATQRPSVDVVTGLIKANFPARISFAVTSLVDSRVVLDTPGAEQLLGSGDMLFMAPDSSKLVRAQGCYVSDTELERLVRYWRGIQIEQPIPTDARLVQRPLWEDMAEKETRFLTENGFLKIDTGTKPDEEDDLMEEAVKIVREQKRASVSLLQRRLRIGYSRASRLIDLMEEKGIVGPSPGGSRPREVLVDSGEDES